MKQMHPSFLSFAIAALVVACGSPKPPPAQAKPKAAATTVNVIPAPRDITTGKGTMRVDGGTDVV